MNFPPSSSPVKSACVFCGASVGNDPAFAEAARDLGALMAADGMRLIYGGGHLGMMARSQTRSSPATVRQSALSQNFYVIASRGIRV